MKFSPYLGFADGRCREAFEFYARCFRGEVQMMMTYGESPMKDQCAPAELDRIMHACVMVGDAALMGADAPQGQGTSMQGMCAMANVDSVEEGRRVFGELSQGGQVQMPFGPVFWGNFGMVIDRFGTPWMVNAAPAA